MVWEIMPKIAVLYRMVIITFAWIAAFAAGTQVFWKVVELLAPKQR